MMPLDYLERVYAGFLGKLIGVYLGRPVENWTHDRIAETFGEITGYIHEARGRRLVITDDDISGTFVFLRALRDHGFNPDITSAQIGETWLNSIIEGKTILWWGGMGHSTEHTAYLRLKDGLRAAESGSAATNGVVTSEQIGAQIFIEGWAMVWPGQPARAADLAGRAARVSHDGEAVYAAQVVAALASAAFTESDLDVLLDTALGLIPADCVIRRLIDDLRRWHATGEDWRATRDRLEAEYGYDRYPGICHVVPNHGLVILALLHGAGEFDRSLSIVNTCGWDTDCNSGNVGCILGIRNGLDGIGDRWREPVADRLYLPSADGGGSITDAVRETYAVVDAGRQLAGLPPLEPRPRFDFSLPGSVQGWRSGTHENGGLRFEGRTSTPTFIPPDMKDFVSGYQLIASPTLYPGQTVTARLRSGTGRLFLSHYNAADESVSIEGPQFEDGAVTWVVPDTGGYPIHEIGIEGDGVLELLDWHGVPTTEWPILPGVMAQRAWTNAVYRLDPTGVVVQNEDLGLLMQGTREWDNYVVAADITPRMAVASGLGVRLQGMRRGYLLMFGPPGEVQLVRLGAEKAVLDSYSYGWKPYETYRVVIEAVNEKLSVWVDDLWRMDVYDDTYPSGAVGYAVESGALGVGTLQVRPA